jgi:hypothetical protein
MRALKEKEIDSTRERYKKVLDYKKINSIGSQIVKIFEANV